MSNRTHMSKRRRLLAKIHRVEFVRRGIRLTRNVLHLMLVPLLLSAGVPGWGHAQTTDTALGPATTTQGQGEFTVNQSNRTEYTQYTDRAVVDWGRDIQQPADHSLEFRQDSGFSILNQNPGERPSEFYGRVICEATCIFANEAGIYFGDGSYIDVGRMFAVSGRIAEGDFMAGVHRFTDIRGSVINRGTMHGDQIALLGQHVANYGVVETPQGSFMMMAGDEIWLREHDSPIITRTQLPDTAEQGSGAGVENWGEIRAQGGEVRLAAGDLLSFAIRQGETASIVADQIVLEGGDEGLVQVSGQLDARGRDLQDPGGRIDVLGDYVVIEGGADLDASGPSGGGEIHIGGGRQGGEELRTARGTFVDADAQIKADATEMGDGGEIVVWGDETAQIYGSLSARGGPQGGRGGFVETSGLAWLDVQRAPQVMARSGHAEDSGGEWLIDPNNISIVNRPSGSEPCNPGDPSCVPCNTADGSCLDPGLSESERTNPIFFSPDVWGFNPGGPILRPSVDNSTLFADLIEETLAQGINVSVWTNTVGDVQGDQAGDIRVDAEIRIDDATVDPDTEAKLVFWAANDIIINEFIGVDSGNDPESTEPTNMALELDIWANSLYMTEAVTSSDEIDPSYLGSLEINASLDTGGAAAFLQGVGITLSDETSPSGGEPVSIRTDGGDLTLITSSGNILLLGDIDTSSNVVTDQEGSRAGGAVNLNSVANRRPPNADDQDTQPSVIVGGHITTQGSINTGGGGLTLASAGGGIEVDSVIRSDGGNVNLFAATKTFAADEADPDSVEQTSGGRIRLLNQADVKTEGGDFNAGYILGQDAQATEVIIQGRIDTGVTTEEGEVPVVGGAVQLAAQAVVAGSTPGRIVIRRFEDDDNPVEIQTHGSLFLAAADGGFSMQNAAIDVTPSSEGVDEETLASKIQIRTDGDVSITENDTEETALIASESIEIAYASSLGAGNILFSGAPRLQSDRIFLQAGYLSGTTGDLARIEVGQASFDGVSEEVTAPSEFFLIQQADLNTEGIGDRIGGGDLSALQELWLASRQGTLTVPDPDAISSPGLDLTLQAFNDVEIESAFASGDEERLGYLTIDLLNSWIVDEATTDNIYSAADNLSITAGLESGSTEPSLQVFGDLAARDSITLHAGAEGFGDLVIDSNNEDPITLASESISLWAGNGDSSGSAKVDLSDALLIKNFGEEGGQVGAFELRQDTLIDDDTLPDVAVFEGGIAGIDYTLRNDVLDASGESIEIGDNGAAALEDTRLHLYAGGLIDLANISDTLNVRTIDIGGINDFTYTAALNEKVSFTSDPESELVLRAGIGGEGVLSFQGDLAIQADEIRLVAGDGSTSISEESISVINLVPSTGAAPTFSPLSTGAGLSFLFRQDADISQADLPNIDTHFGGTAPDRLAIRTDNGQILINDFSQEPILQAVDTLILSAQTVTLDRQDGQDLVIDQVLQVDPPEGTESQIQIRSDNVELKALGSPTDAETLAEVLPGSTVRLTGFDSLEDETVVGEVPPAFDFDTLPDSAPDRLSLEQDGDLSSTNDTATNNLIDPSQQLGPAAGSGVTLNEYALTSHRGGIQVTPESVDQATLFLTLISEDGLPSESREIVFAGDYFSLSALEATTPFGWTVDSTQGDTDSLTIETEGGLSLIAGIQGSGDLDFNFGEDGTIVLDANSIFLRAGDDATERTDPELPPSTSLVKANSESLNFILREDEQGGSAFSILQGGTLSNLTPGDGESQIPSEDQFEIYDSAGEPVETMSVMTLNTIDGDIRIENLFSETAKSILPTRQLILFAGYYLSEIDRSVAISQNDLGLELDLDFTHFDTFVALAPSIDFSATGQSVIKLDDSEASSSRVLLLGAADPTLSVGATSPKRIFLSQERGFEDSEDCTTGCLPNPNTQLGPGGAFDVDYTLFTSGPQGTIEVNDILAQKVAFSDLTLDAANVTFRIDSPRDLDLAVNSLMVSSADQSFPTQIRFEAVGEDPLTIFTLGDQTYDGNIVLDGRTELQGQVITAAYTIDAADGTDEEGADELVILGSEQILLRGDIGQSGDSQIELLHLLFNPNAGGIPNVEFGSEAGGTTQITADEIGFFYSDDFDATSSETIRIPTTSTIFKRNGKLEFHSETFTMGMGEKLSVQGDLLIDASEKATLGDLSALNIAVISPTTVIQRRPAGFFLTQDVGLLPDAGVDYVANTIVFQDSAGGAPNLLFEGTGADPVFGLTDPSQIPDWMKAYSTFQNQPNAQALVSDNFDLAEYAQLADLHPDGASRDDPSTLFFDQKIPPRPPIWQPSNWIPFNRASVEELDIEAEPMTPRQYKSQLVGATLIDNVGGDLTPWDVWPLPVSEARLNGTEAAEAVALLHELFGPRGGRAERVRQTLQQALDQYRRNTGARRVVGFELRRYVKNRPSSLFEAYQTLEDLDLLFAMHRSLGLTPGEYRPIQKRWLDLIKPNGITSAQLAEAIHPSQYVRGSDVLDIFGD